MFAIKYKDGSFLSESGATWKYNEILWIQYWMRAQAVKGEGVVITCHELFKELLDRYQILLKSLETNDNTKNWNSH